MAPLRLITLGALQLVDATGRDVAVGQRKLLVLLAYLARRAPRAATREELASLMWGDRPEENARASLRQALFHLKRTLGDALDVTHDAAALRPYGVSFDAAAFEREVTTGQYREAALRWNGDFLLRAEDAGGGPFRVWLEVERARLRRLLTRALEALTSDAAARGAWPEAVTWAERWADTQPLEERPHRRLIELLSLDGRTVEALARHAGFVAHVRAEMDGDPSGEFLRLGKQLERSVREGASREGRPPGGAGALRRPDMVGRQDAFAQLTSAWHEARRGRATVVVVEGEAGIGKTRLADEFLRMVEPRGAAFVVLRARAYDADRDVRLALVRELLSPLGEAPGLLGAPRAALAELARLVPSVRDQIRDLPGPSDYGRALDEAVARIVADVSVEAPVVLFVDDLPRTDPESRRLVLSVARRLDRDARVLVLLTVRSGELGHPDELRDLRGLRHLRLKPLDLSEVESLLSSMVTLRADDRRAVVERLSEASGGVPSAIVDTIAAMVDQQQLVHDGNGGWCLGGPAEATQPTPADFVSRSLRGRYTTERVVYKGGVLTTYAAVDAIAGRRVELHVPNRRLAAPAEAAHFLQTLERVAAIAHPGILPIADYGVAGGVLFYATPEVESESLRERIARERPLPVAESIRIATEIARALTHAHERGVQHHDLRPKHILVGTRGVLLTRLGLAQALAATPSADGSAPDDTGVLIGAPAYLSPEQLADESAADARSDIYSLGCVLYEMLTGEPPFGARGRGLIARKLTNAPPAVRTMRGDVPEALEQVVRRSLSRMPADRYCSADEIVDALEGVRA